MTKHAELNPYAPRLRQVVANILMDAGWLHGSFHVPERQALMDYFATGVQLLKTTRGAFPASRRWCRSSPCVARRSR
jgi:hypothetical protein